LSKSPRFNRLPGSVQLYAFDSLAMNGDDLRPQPLSLGKASLKKLARRRMKTRRNLKSLAKQAGHDLDHSIDLRSDWKVSMPTFRLFGLARLDRVDALTEAPLGLVTALARFCERDTLARVGAVFAEGGQSFWGFLRRAAKAGEEPSGSPG
jgi:hypothetical protein